MSAFSLIFAAPLAIVTLQQAEQNAMSNHPDLHIAAGEQVAAEERSHEVRGGLMPQVNAFSSYRKRNGESVNSISIDRDNYLMGVEANVLLTDFGRTTSQLRSSKYLAKAAASNSDSSELDVRTTVRLAYIDALELKALIDVAKETVSNEERHLEQVQAFVEIGTRPAIDVARLKTEVAQAHAGLIQAENGYAMAKARLNRAMGMRGSTDFDVTEDALPELAAESLSTEQLFASAYNERPELTTQRWIVRARERNIKAARRRYAPELHGAADISSGAETWMNPLWSSTLGVTLNWTLFDGLSAVAATHEQKALLSVEKARLVGQEQQTWQEIDEARISVSSAKAQLESANQALVSAQELLRLAEERYKAGAGDSLELSDAQLALTTASISYVRTKYDVAAARAELLRAIGRQLWQ